MKSRTQHTVVAMGFFLLAATGTACRAAAAENPVSEIPGHVGSLIDQTWTWCAGPASFGPFDIDPKP
jgi:hypothetical protein